MTTGTTDETVDLTGEDRARSGVDTDLLRDIAAICWSSVSRTLAGGAQTAGSILTDIGRRLEAAGSGRELAGTTDPAPAER